MKRYVQVASVTSVEGAVTPTDVFWDEGKRYHIDRVLDRRPAASLKVGGKGMRYLVEIAGRQSYLYYEGPAWFVEEIVRNAPVYATPPL
ncbi:MAG: hypothetical protein LBS17_02715 [Actinomycetes bacterium]|nr:hypothetical protein [Actinomycetes bacterium]